MSITTATITPNKFSTDDADRLWQYLTDEQRHFTETDPFIRSLPNRKELKAIAVLLTESLKEADLVHMIPFLFLEVKDHSQPHQGIFRISHYHLLTEHWKECGQCQTLQQDLTELAENMID